jgi:hypothetical protein
LKEPALSIFSSAFHLGSWSEKLKDDRPVLHQATQTEKLQISALFSEIPEICSPTYNSSCHQSSAVKNKNPRTRQIRPTRSDELLQGAI